MYERFISLLGPLLVSEEYVEKAKIYHKYSLMLFLYHFTYSHMFFISFPYSLNRNEI
jgi:hypothetical protein